MRFLDELGLMTVCRSIFTYWVVGPVGEVRQRLRAWTLKSSYTAGMTSTGPPIEQGDGRERGWVPFTTKEKNAGEGSFI